MFVLAPGESACRRGYATLTVTGGEEGPRNCIVPVLAGQNLVLRPRAPGLEIALAEDEGRLSPLPPGRTLAAWLRRNLTSARRSVLRYGPLEIFAEGPGEATRPYRKALNIARHSGLPFDGPFVTAHPELLAGWPPRARAQKTAPAPATGEAAPRLRLAVVLHLYYVELWDEIENLLAGWRLPFTLIVTLVEPHAALEARIAAAFPGAQVRLVENRGRDVRPFLLLLEEGALDGFDLVCKIHGKRSLGGGRLPIFGEIMRRAAFLDLIADPARVEALVGRFAAQPDLGIAGPGIFLSGTRGGRRDPIGPVNRRAVEALAQRLGAPIDPARFDFFEGTMFWVRPAGLRRLAALGLSREFAPEAGRLDGALEHAVERIFNHAVRAGDVKRT